jgi:hypothetical protein
MPELSFTVERAEPVPFSAAPLLSFKLRIVQSGTAAAPPIHAVALRCQVRIEPARRRYDAPEQERLLDLFGAPERWGHTLRPMLWTHTSTVVPPFHGVTVADLPVSCSYDFNVAATKYFAALADGDVPLLLLFSGTVFYEAEDGALQAAQIPWDREAAFRLPVRVWRDLMEHYYPNSAALQLRKDVFDRLALYKGRHGLLTWEQAIESLLADEERVSP